MSPCLKQLVFKVDLGDTLSGSGIKEVAHGSVRRLEVSGRAEHLLILLRDPVRGLELIVCNLVDTQLNNNVPAQSVTWHGEENPLKTNE